MNLQNPVQILPLVVVIVTIILCRRFHILPNYSLLSNTPAAPATSRLNPSFAKSGMGSKCIELNGSAGES
jgi:hypothetical protein